jgi:hypothetical protein
MLAFYQEQKTGLNQISKTLLIQMIDNWAFMEPRNLAVFTTAKILSKADCILYVLHDDEGDWQFHSGQKTHDEEPKIVALSEMVKLDPSIVDLVDLPMGTIAIRQTKNDFWQRLKAEDASK